MKYLAFTIWLTLLSPCLTFARGEFCVDLFRETGSLEVADKFRGQLFLRARAAVLNLDAVEQESMKIAVDFLRHQKRVSAASIQSLIQSSKTLSKFEFKTPQELQILKTSDIPEVGEPAVKAMLEPGLAESQLVSVLESDPYFSWLKHNALRHLVAPSRYLSPTQQVLGLGQIQAEPAKLFVEYRKKGLAPGLAILQVQRNLDPTFPADVRSAIDRAVKCVAQRMALDERVLAVLASAGVSAGPREASLLMPSLQIGRANFQAQAARLVRLYGSAFPETAFNRLHSLAKRYDPSVYVVEQFRVQRVLGRSDAEIESRLREKVEVLRSKLGLNSELSVIRLLEVSQRTLASRVDGSYIYALADVFESPVGVMPREGRPTNIVSRRLHALGQLIEIAEALATSATTAVYLEDIGHEFEARLTGARGD